MSTVSLMTTLLTEDCSRFLPPQHKTLGRRLFEDVSVVRQDPLMTQNANVVDLEDRRHAVDCQSDMLVRDPSDTVFGKLAKSVFTTDQIWCDATKLQLQSSVRKSGSRPIDSGRIWKTAIRRVPIVASVCISRRLWTWHPILPVWVYVYVAADANSKQLSVLKLFGF